MRQKAKVACKKWHSDSLASVFQSTNQFLGFRTVAPLDIWVHGPSSRISGGSTILQLRIKTHENSSIFSKCCTFNKHVT